MLTIDQLDAFGPNTLFEYFYSDGVAWGVGSPAEAREAVTYCGAEASTLRYKRLL